VSAVSEQDLRSFASARPRLVRIARRVLVNPDEADDVVQEAWVRWQRADRRQVSEPTAFLTTTTTRLALNVGQSARVRHEASAGSWPADEADPGADPAFGAVQREELEQALSRLLERLTATERAVYILREGFEYPHRRIAQVLGLRETHVRQLVTRARRHVAGTRRLPVADGAHRRLLDGVLAAAQNGELGTLEQLLAGDLGPSRGALAA
jgi:RNA polymerase sigma-70 factor (ECF subfamily)